MKSISKRPLGQFSSYRLTSAAAVCATLLCGSFALAQEVIAPPTSEAPPVASLAVPQALHFGQAKQWFLSAETYWTPFHNKGGNTGDISYSWSSAEGSRGTFEFNLQPVVGYFFTDVIYGRLGFDIAYSYIDGTDDFGLGVEPGVGVSFPLAPRLALAPFVGVNFMYTDTNSVVKLNLEVHVPVVIDITDRVAFITGLYYAQGLVNHASIGGVSANGDKIGTIGLTAGLLGYW